MVEERRGSANIERHIQTVMIALTTGSIMFAANYFFNDTGSKAHNKAQLDFAVSQIVELRADLKAAQLLYARRDELATLAGRQDALESRLRKNEADIGRLETRVGLAHSR
jgi:hypothetical protein